MYDPLRISGLTHGQLGTGLDCTSIQEGLSGKSPAPRHSLFPPIHQRSQSGHPSDRGCRATVTDESLPIHMACRQGHPGTELAKAYFSCEYLHHYIKRTQLPSACSSSELGSSGCSPSRTHGLNGSTDYTYTHDVRIV